MHMCIFTYDPEYTLPSLNYATHSCVCTAYYVVLDNQVLCSFLGKTVFPTLSIL